MYQLLHKLNITRKYRYEHVYRYKLIDNLYNVYSNSDMFLLEHNAKKIAKLLKTMNFYVRSV